MKLLPPSTHPIGEHSTASTHPDLLSEHQSLPVDTFGGRVHVEWDPQAAVTPLGQLAFFIEFLKLSNLFDPFVADCPLHLTSPNAPTNRDILGTLLLSVLAGHTRYAHITALRSDGVNATLLGMRKLVSEDSLRRALLAMDETLGIAWLQQHLMNCYVPLLHVLWILDVDTSVKVLYGHCWNVYLVIDGRNAYVVIEHLVQTA